MGADELTATLCQTFLRQPLAVIDGLPGGAAELTPAELRALADGLLRIAADAEARPMGARNYRPQRRAYRLGAGPGGEPAPAGCWQPTLLASLLESVDEAGRVVQSQPAATGAEGRNMTTRRAGMRP